MKRARKRSSARWYVILQVTASPPFAKSPGRCFRKYVCPALWDVSRQTVLENHDSEQSIGGRKER